MTGFSKLDSSIIHSTIWREPNHIRIVWITMLAMADAKGRVMASVPGLADAARVSIEECTEALKCFMSSDKWSRDEDNEGRRIEEIRGGWLILNYMKYRDPTSTERVREWRKRKESNETVATVSNGCQRRETASEADTEADTDIKKKIIKRKTQLPRDWEPKESHYILANEQGVAVAEHLEQFRDYHLSKGSVYKDWDRAFNTWLRNGKRFGCGEKKTQHQKNLEVLGITQEELDGERTDNRDNSGDDIVVVPSKV